MLRSVPARSRAARRTYIWGQDDRRRGKVQLGHVEWLVQEVCRIELVEWPDARLTLRRHLLGSWLSWPRPHLHACHALRDATHAGCTRSRRRAIRIGRLEARGGGSRRAVCLGSTVRGGLRLCVLTRVSVASSHRLRSAKLSSAW